MSARVEVEQWVAFPLEPVFLFFTNPENLPRIMPPESRTRIERLSLVAPVRPGEPGTVPNGPRLAGVGSEIVTSFRVRPPLPFRAQWIARITEFEWHRYFADIQEKGPFRSWHHRHEFGPEMRNGIAGTMVRDRIEYSIGPGVLGDMAEKLWVGRQLRRTFAQRQKTLPALLSGI